MEQYVANDIFLSNFCDVSNIPIITIAWLPGTVWRNNSELETVLECGLTEIVGNMLLAQRTDTAWT